MGIELGFDDSWDVRTPYSIHMVILKVNSYNSFS